MSLDRPIARPIAADIAQPMTGRAVGGLLDTYPGAAAAYSLRKLRSGYTGPVVRVRRSSDNAEQDFVPSEIGDGTLASFCGSGDGFVTTWYGQSTNANDIGNATEADQPKIVNGGSLITQNGKPAVDFAGAEALWIDKLILDPIAGDVSVICVAAPDTLSNNEGIAGQTQGNDIGYSRGGLVSAGGEIFDGSYINSTFNASTGSQQILGMLYDDSGPSLVAYRNGTLETDKSMNDVTRDKTKERFGVGGAENNGDNGIVGQYYDGKLQEVVAYEKDPSVIAVMDKQNNHYSTY